VMKINVKLGGVNTKIASTPQRPLGWGDTS
jgi:hypothetical protein